MKATPARCLLFDGLVTDGLVNEERTHFAYQAWVANEPVARVTTRFIIQHLG